MMWLENDLLNLHFVEDIISFNRLAHRHNLVSHEAVSLVSRHVLENVGAVATDSSLC
jgi:hypothetical protein